VVWQIATGNGDKPDHDLTVVSTLHLADVVQYGLSAGTSAATQKRGRCSRAWRMATCGSCVRGDA